MESARLALILSLPPLLEVLAAKQFEALAIRRSTAQVEVGVAVV